MNNSLYELIYSLSQGEKKHFTNHAKRHVIGERNNYLVLFDCISQASTMNKEILTKKITEAGLVKNLAVLKSQLYSHILESLGIYHSRITIDGQIRMLLDQFQVLFNKELYSLAEKVLHKAKNLAGENSNHVLRLETLKYEKRLLTIKPNGAHENYIESIFAHENSTLSSIQEINNAWRIAALIKNFIRATAWTRSKKEIQNIQKLIEHAAMANNNYQCALSKIYQYGAYSYYFHYIRDKIQQRNFSKKWTNEMEQNHAIILDLPLEYYDALNNWLYSVNIDKNPEEFNEVFGRFKNILNKIKPVSIENIEARIFVRTSNVLLAWYNKTGQFQKGAKELMRIESELLKFESQLAHDQQAILYRNIANIYFGMEEYLMALSWMNKILNAKHHLINERYFFLAHIFNLIIHFEIGNYHFLEYALKNTNRLLIKYEVKLKSEALIMDFIQHQILYIKTKKNLSEKLKILYSQLNKIIHEENEEVLFHYFDIMAWIKSKITNQTFAQILQH